jgi:hypothetical protein
MAIMDFTAHNDSIKDADRQAGANAIAIEGDEWPSLEVRIKSLNYIGDTLLEFSKRFYDGRSIIEQYRSGGVALHFHGRCDGRWCCLTSRSVAVVAGARMMRGPSAARKCLCLSILDKVCRIFVHLKPLNGWSPWSAV